MYYFLKDSIPNNIPRIPNLSNLGDVEKPLNPFSMIKAVIPLGPALGSVFAEIDNKIN